MRPMALPALDLPRLATVALASALGLHVAWTVTGAWGARDPVPSSRAAGGAVDPLEAVKAARLFGTLESAPAQTAVAATISTQGLVLVGVLAQTDPLAGRAIIGESAGAARVYAVGGTLPGGSRLAEVYADRVILDRGGSLETLPLPRQGGTPSGAAMPVGMASPDASAAPPGDLAAVIRWQAVMRADQPSGIRVYPGADAATFERLGLRPGDLVLAINDAPLADPSNGEQLLRSLAGTPQARVTIERGGRTETRLLDLTQIARGSAGSAPSPPLN